MTLALHHLAVVVADLPRSEAFYSGLLGLPVLRRWEDHEGRPRSVWLALGEEGAFLAVERALQAEPLRGDQAPGWHCLALAIPAEEREATRRRLEAAGVAVVRESPYTLYVRDPDGNLLGLSHYPYAVPSGPQP